MDMSRGHVNLRLCDKLSRAIHTQFSKASLFSNNASYYRMTLPCKDSKGSQNLWPVAISQSLILTFVGRCVYRYIDGLSGSKPKTTEENKISFSVSLGYCFTTNISK